ncbi:uncharacterized protein [Dermacentor albipictus]|uniref:uncharacterized protein n=1 Tax=Dermacentor albipictus TaxID=60249 RepID=UPI0031FBDB7D
MKSSLAVAILVGSLMNLAIADSEQSTNSTEQQSEQPGNCERAVPLPPWAKSYRGRCWYICKGWPMRIEFEPEGISCGLVTVNNAKRVCKKGNCVKEESVSGQSQQKRLIPTQVSAPKQESGTGNLLGASNKPASDKETSTKKKPTSSLGGLLSKKH